MTRVRELPATIREVREKFVRLVIKGTAPENKKALPIERKGKWFTHLLLYKFECSA